jgi:hypothetical protein
MNYFLKVLIGLNLCFAFLTGKAGVKIEFIPDDAVIVINSNASETERFAASELQKYIDKITGRKIPISKNAGQADKFNIFVGITPQTRKYLKNFDRRICSSGSDSFIIDAKEKQLTLIGGGDRGTLYSIYEFLEQQGCRWFFPGKLGEVIPSKTKLILNSGYKKYVPDFIQRSLGLAPVKGIDLGDMIDWGAKNRLNRAFGLRFYFVRKHLPREQWNAWTKRGGMQNWQWICHNLNFMVPSAKYFKTNPEYYALYKGKRERMGSPGKPGYGGGNICTTNKDVIDICAQFAINWFDKHKDGVVVPVWPGDGAVKWCECNSCRKLKGINFMPGKRGSMSRRMVTFANAVARITAKKYPDRYILCPAYSNYIRPTKIKIEKNVLIQYCLHGDLVHAVDRSSVNAKEKKWLDAWASQAPGRMGIWDYFLLGDHRSANKENKAMLPVWRRAKNNLKYFKDKNINWYYTQTSPKYWKHNILPFYVTARYAWDADQNFDAFLTDFCSKLYGKAGGYLKKYYNTIGEAVAKADWYPQVYSDVAVPSPKVFTSAVVKLCDKYLKAAEKTQLSDLEKQRLALVRATFDNIKSNIGVQGSLGIDPGSPWGIKRGNDSYIINPKGKAISDHDIKTLILNAMDSGTYDAQFKKIIFRAPKRIVSLRTIENNAIKVVVLPEIGGRLLRIIDKKSGRNFLKESIGKDTVDSIGIGYFNYGGYEEYFGKNFASPGWEIPFGYCLKGKSMILDAELDGLKITRTLSLASENSRTITIKTVLKNTTGVNKKCVIRIHPQVSMGIPCEDTAVFVGLKQGGFKELTVCQANDKFIGNSCGVWGFADKKRNTGLANIFDSLKASAYVCKTGNNYFNFELIGKEILLAPGNEYIFKHQYVVLNDFKEQFKTLLK